MTEGVVYSILNFHPKDLNSGPVSHDFILNFPTVDCFLVARAHRKGGLCCPKMLYPPTHLIWSLCENIGSIFTQLKRLKGVTGLAKRWFHSEVCLKMSLNKAKSAEKMKNWYFRRPDCKE